MEHKTVRIDVPATSRKKIMRRVEELLAEHEGDGWGLVDTISVKGTTIGLVLARD